MSFGSRVCCSGSRSTPPPQSPRSSRSPGYRCSTPRRTHWGSTSEPTTASTSSPPRPQCRTRRSAPRSRSNCFRQKLGEPVTFRVAAERQFLGRLTGAGVPAGAAELLITREWAILAGENDYTTSAFQQITGRPLRPGGRVPSRAPPGIRLRPARHPHPIPGGPTPVSLRAICDLPCPRGHHTLIPNRRSRGQYARPKAAGSPSRKLLTKAKFSPQRRPDLCGRPWHLTNYYKSFGGLQTSYVPGS